MLEIIEGEVKEGSAIVFGHSPSWLTTIALLRQLQTDDVIVMHPVSKEVGTFDIVDQYAFQLLVDGENVHWLRLKEWASRRPGGTPAAELRGLYDNAVNATQPTAR